MDLKKFDIGDYIVIQLCAIKNQNSFKLNLLVLILFLAVFAQTYSAESNVQQAMLVYSTESEKWVQGPEVKVRQTKSPEGADIQIFPDQKLQTIDGFGACFNELGWEALLSLPETKRNEILQDLFSKEGVNFTICRMPLGSNDYSLSYYSYNDVPEDFEMKNFNIDRDRYIL